MQDLAAHLAPAPSNATYLSWETQNETIGICGDTLARQVADEVRSARLFSILVDETTDTATKEQCSLSVHYVKDNAVEERFLAFCDLQGNMTAVSIASAVVTKLTELQLNVALICRQGYDGVSSTSGRFHGVPAEIKKFLPAASYVHCVSHVLNLVTQKACIRNTHSEVKETANFFQLLRKTHRLSAVTHPSECRLKEA